MREPRRYLYELCGLPGRGDGCPVQLLHRVSPRLRGTLEDAPATAAAIEMLHNAFLVHDDIEDRAICVAACIAPGAARYQRPSTPAMRSRS